MNVLIADDQAIMRSRMRDVLTREPDVLTVALANDGAEAIERSRANSLDVVVMDITMPRVNGIVALTTLQGEWPTLPVVMVSVTADAYTVRNCLALGAKGFVAKESSPDELIKALRAVLAGEIYLCRVVRAALAGAGEAYRKLAKSW